MPSFKLDNDLLTICCLPLVAYHALLTVCSSYALFIACCTAFCLLLIIHCLLFIA